MLSVAPPQTPVAVLAVISPKHFNNSALAVKIFGVVFYVCLLKFTEFLPLTVLLG